MIGNESKPGCECNCCEHGNVEAEKGELFTLRDNLRLALNLAMEFTSDRKTGVCLSCGYAPCWDKCALDVAFRATL